MEVLRAINCALVGECDDSTQPQFLASTSFFLRAKSNCRNEDEGKLLSPIECVEHLIIPHLLRGQPQLNLRMWQSIKASVSSIIIQTDTILPLPLLIH